MTAIRVLGFSGSLRKDSYNTAALRAAKELMPEGMELEIFDLSAIPLYNGDVEAQGFPPAVVRFHERIAASHGLLIATPEYNYSSPGVLKNAIDWASRPSGKAPLMRKPTAIFGASPGVFGSARAQYHLRQCFVGLDMPVVNKPEVMIGKAPEKFDAQGKLTDEKTKEVLRSLLVSLGNTVGTHAS